MKSHDFEDSVRLTHILESIDAIREYTREGREAFLSDRMMQDAVIRHLTIIGEAANSLSIDLTDRYTHVGFRGIADLRNFIVHEYFRISLETIWEIVEEHVPNLQLDAQQIQRDLRNQHITGRSGS